MNLKELELNNPNSHEQKGEAKMELKSILSLINQNIKGKRADIRTRREDGSLEYDFIDQKEPIIVEMDRVEIIQDHFSKKMPLIPWLYWRWKGYSCGYSGTSNQTEWANYYIMIEQ